MEEEYELIEAFWIEQGGKAHMKEDLSFYSASWDFLMPVWCKACDWYTHEFGLLTSTFEISSLSVVIKAKYQSAFKMAIPTFGNVDISKIYTVLVAFIKWYNENKKP